MAKRLTQFQKQLRALAVSVPEASTILGVSETQVKAYAEHFRDGIGDRDQLDADKFGGTLQDDGSITKGSWILSRADVMRLKRERAKR